MLSGRRRMLSPPQNSNEDRQSVHHFEVMMAVRVAIGVAIRDATCTIK